jgi:cyclase
MLATSLAASRLYLTAAIAFLSFGALADTSVTTQRTVTQLGDGVFAIRHADGADGNPQGNTTVIIGSRDVLVVDSAYLPSSAREDIAQIRRWTDKPVRYLVNTHWHPDHQRGNSAYVDAFPGVAIIAHPETARLMAYETGNLERYPRRVGPMQESLDKGIGADGKALDAAQKRELAETIAGRRRVIEELKGFRMQRPTLLFQNEMDVDLGDRVVQLRHSGIGDTHGDVWAYLPREQILVTGDVLVAPVPYFFAGYPSGLASTLRKLLQLEVKAVVPGHGDVMRDKAYMQAVADMMDTIIGQVHAAVVRLGSLGARLEDVRKEIDVSRYRQQFAGDDPNNQEYFDQSIEGLIRNAFHQAPK